MDGEKHIRHIMNKARTSFLLAVMTLTAFLFSIWPVMAQENVLVIGVAENGTITAQEAQDWAFTALGGSVISIRVEAQSDSLDPIVELWNSSGVLVIANDDRHYPADNNAILEAITLPRTDTYTVRVRGYGDSAGEYSIVVLSGYANEHFRDDFTVSTAWRSDNSLASLNGENGTLTIQLEGTREIARLTNSAVPSLNDFYAEIEISNVLYREGWSIGLIVQDSPTHYYAIEVGHIGAWRVIETTNGEDTIIRDWTVHPSIDPNLSAFKFGILARNNAIDTFFNGAFIGQVTFPSSRQQASTGLIVETANAIGSSITVSFDTLTITTPEDEVAPEQLIAGNGTFIVQSLERQRVIANGGTMALTVPEAFVQTPDAGVAVLDLGRGTTYEEFAFGGRFRLAGGDEFSACGLVFHRQEAERYSVAYLDEQGAYEVSLRDEEGFSSGLFGERSVIPNEQHTLIVVVYDGQLLYYVDYQLAGVLDYVANSGEVGIGALSFGFRDASCQFNDLWLWTWDDLEETQ